MEKKELGLLLTETLLIESPEEKRKELRKNQQEKDGAGALFLILCRR